VLVPFPPPKPFVEQLREVLDGSVALRGEALAEAMLPPAARATVSALRALPMGVPVLIPPLFAEVH
jgi:hypothetical protein